MNQHPEPRGTKDMDASYSQTLIQEIRNLVREAKRIADALEEIKDEKKEVREDSCQK